MPDPRALLDEAREHLRESHELLDRDREREAETVARASFETYRSAMNWAEAEFRDDLFDQAHRELDEAGAFVRRTFGCAVLFEQGSYWQTCPVALAHNRSGLSVRAVIRASECSVCRSDPEDCDHITGRMYGDQPCYRIITEAEIPEISLVPRPAQPDARITRVPVSHEQLEQRLGRPFAPGTPLNCDFCLSTCSGVVRPWG